MQLTKSNNIEMIEKFRQLYEGKKIDLDESDSGKYKLHITEYSNGNLYLGLFENDEPYANITKNFPGRIPWYEFYVDVNNFPEAIDMLFENNIARYTGKMMQSGFCHYPLFALVPEIIKEVEE